MLFRICSGSRLMASSDAYWIWLIHFPVTASKRSSTFDLPAKLVTRAAVAPHVGRDLPARHRRELGVEPPRPTT